MFALCGGRESKTERKQHDDTEGDDIETVNVESAKGTANGTDSVMSAEEELSGRRGSNEDDQSIWWRQQIEELRTEIAGKQEAIGALRATNGDLKREMGRMEEAENQHLSLLFAICPIYKLSFYPI